MHIWVAHHLKMYNSLASAVQLRIWLAFLPADLSSEVCFHLSDIRCIFELWLTIGQAGNIVKIPSRKPCLNHYLRAGSSDTMSFPLPDLGQFTALKPPPGITPNLIDPYSGGKMYTVAATIIVVLMVVLVTNRHYTKFFIIRKLGWDDRELEI